MTPEHKRRLETLALNIRALNGVVNADYVSAELLAIAAESLPKCATCRRKFIGPEGDLICSEARGGPVTRYVKPDFGCVLHSDLGTYLKMTAEDSKGQAMAEDKEPALYEYAPLFESKLGEQFSAHVDQVVRDIRRHAQKQMLEELSRLVEYKVTETQTKGYLHPEYREGAVATWRELGQILKTALSLQEDDTKAAKPSGG